MIVRARVVITMVSSPIENGAIAVNGEHIADVGPFSELRRSHPADDIVDLGDITTARGPEMLVPLWLRLFGVFGQVPFGIRVVRGK